MNFLLISFFMSLNKVKINCCGTYIQVFHRNVYVYMHTMQSYTQSECASWKSSIWQGQRSCTWPIFKLNVTLDLKCICAKFVILRQIVLELWWKQADRRTDRHTRRSHKNKTYSCGILDKQVYEMFFRYT